jgi:hypothetical protein
MHHAIRDYVSRLGWYVGRLAFALCMMVWSVRPAYGIGEPGTLKYAETVKLRARSLRALEMLWRQRPVNATALGIHRYDDELATWTASARRTQLRDITQMEDALKSVNTTVLSLNDSIDHSLILSNLESQRLELEDIKQWGRDPAIYADECVNGIYYLLLRQGEPLAKRMEHAIQRLRQIPRVIAEMNANIKNPPRVLADEAAEEFDTGASFIEEALPPASGVLSHGNRRELDTALHVASGAMRGAAIALRERLDSDTGKIGMGQKLYEKKLRTDNFLPFDSDSLVRLGERILEETQNEIAVLSWIRDTDTLWTVPPQPDPPAPSSFGHSAILAYYRAEIDSVRRFVIEHDLVTVPRGIGELVPVETPTFMRAVLPGIAMEPAAPFEQPQPGDRKVDAERRRILARGTFYVRPIPQPLSPADRQRYYAGMLHRSFQGSVVHEGFPGHHLQLSIANRIIDPVRRAQSNTAFMEGWALYCEELMQRNHLYADPWSRIRMLGGLRFRACRVIVDAKLQRNEFNFDQAVDFLRRNANTDSATAVGEVKRYCHTPTQATAYLVGKEQIVSLREEYRRVYPDTFTLKRFHDALLAVGSIPPSLARRIVLER